MKKSHYRDYATAAFRFWAATPGGSEAYKKKIWEDAVLAQHKEEGRTGISNPSEAAVMRAEKELEKKVSEIKDLDAVEKTIHQIECMLSERGPIYSPEAYHYKEHSDGSGIIKALKIVYMAEPEREPRRGEIIERVHKAEIDIPASEPTIYRWLRMACQLFGEARGLRM